MSKKVEKIKKEWRFTSLGFAIRLREDRWLRFDITHHARRRSIEPKISFQKMATTMLRVRDQLEGAIASKRQHSKVAITDHGSSAALIIALEANGAKIITVREYPLMILPKNLRLI